MDFCSIPLAGKLCSAADAIDFVSDPGKAITEGIGNWIAKSTGQLAAAAADLAAEAVNKTTNVDLGAGWFRNNFELILPIGLVLLVATFCAQLIRAAVKRDGQALGQAFTGTMSGVLFAFSAIAATTVAIEVVDALSDGLFKAADSSLSDAVRRMVKVSQLGALGPLGWLVCAFCGIGAAIGAFLYWCVMMVRKVGILVMVTLAVFAGAGGGWEVARRWRRGWIEATATLVCSKLLMTVIFLLGISAMGKADSKGGLDALADVMSGIVIMILVLLCPYATFKFVHWASEGTNGEDIHRAGGAGAQLAKQHAERAARKAAQAAATAGTGGAAAGAGAASTAAPQGPDAIPGGGFPGDIAPTSSGGQGGGSESSGNGAKNGLEQAVQPPPTRTTEDTSGLGGSPAQGGSGSAAASGQGGGWMSAPPTGATPPPQGAPPATGDAANGPVSPTPPPTGL
ncbi:MULTISPECIES: SCO6881 family protein [Streptomyces]|uniref:SCO6881 family protein n=1 Tax=Streptomyces TaxID=1883 RepID=UPI00163D3027|nr:MULTISPECIES: type IV secretion system protein [Streptomyces]MBC2878071.1 type IV secretion system protein [Streptomyces sp. TYQ1024]UBI40022.1 type IV secretion system protein [Streptomyces mobaraensis]UKW32602.1 type IV secretion system protein [Streptomyces sp. TYQ1024]